MSSWTGRRVLVTGAGGFIGSHLTERLVELGARTRALVRYTSTGTWGWLDDSPLRGDVDVIAGDVRDRDSVHKAMDDIEVVFHLAALIGIPYSYHAPESYVHTNIGGTLHVLEEALDRGVARVVHTSTSEVYGTAQRVPIDEQHPLCAQSPYAATKVGADKLAEAFHRSFGLPVAIARPFNTFGPRQSSRAIIPTIITQALGEAEIRLGNLEATRDFTYVTDTVEGFLRLGEVPEAVGQVINLGSGREIAVGQLAQRIIALAGRAVPLAAEEKRLRPELSEVGRLCADAGKARQLLGWQPERTLEEGLTQTMAWMREHVDRYRVGAYVI